MSKENETKSRGRPKFRAYDVPISIRTTKETLARLRKEFNEYCSANGQYDQLGNRRSFNEFVNLKLLQKVK